MQTALVLLAVLERLASLDVAAERVLIRIKALRAEKRGTLTEDEVKEIFAELDVTDAAWAEQLARLRADGKAA